VKKYVYAASAGGAIKIGCSMAPNLRAKVITDYPGSVLTPKRLLGRRLRLMKIVPGGLTEERRIHRELRDYRIQGEWFHRDCRTDPAFEKFFSKSKCVHPYFIATVVQLEGHVHKALKMRGIAAKMSPNLMAAEILTDFLVGPAK